MNPHLVGQHLFVQRRVGPFTYTHHGLASEQGRVIHFTGEPSRKRDARVEETSVAAFADGAPVEVRDHPGRRRSTEESVARARSQIGKSGYDLTFNNCEHFVSWCIDGHSTSAQIDTVGRTVMVAGVAAGVAFSLPWLVVGTLLFERQRRSDEWHAQAFRDIQYDLYSLRSIVVEQGAVLAAVRASAERQEQVLGQILDAVYEGRGAIERRIDGWESLDYSRRAEGLSSARAAFARAVADGSDDRLQFEARSLVLTARDLIAYCSARLQSRSESPEERQAFVLGIAMGRFSELDGEQALFAESSSQGIARDRVASALVTLILQELDLLVQGTAVQHLRRRPQVARYVCILIWLERVVGANDGSPESGDDVSWCDGLPEAAQSEEPCSPITLAELAAAFGVELGRLPVSRAQQVTLILGEGPSERRLDRLYLSQAHCVSLFGGPITSDGDLRHLLACVEPRSWSRYGSALAAFGCDPRLFVSKDILHQLIERLAEDATEQTRYARGEVAWYVWSGSLRGIRSDAASMRAAVEATVRSHLPCMLDAAIRVSRKPRGLDDDDCYFAAPYEDQFPSLFDGSIDVSVHRGSDEPPPLGAPGNIEPWRPPTVKERLREVGWVLLGSPVMPQRLHYDFKYEFRAFAGRDRRIP